MKTKGKMIARILIPVILVGMLLVPLAAANSATVSIPDASAPKGETVTVPINIANVDNMCGANIWLGYDKQVVTVEKVEDGNIGTVTYNINNNAGKTKMVWDTTEGKTGSFVFAHITLKAVGDPGDTSPLDLDVKELYDCDLKDIMHTVADGEFRIPPTPTATVTSSNAAGIETNTFELSDDVYCYAENLPASTDVDIYVVANKDVWNDGDGLTDVSGVYETKMTGSDGSIANTKIWPAPLTEGEYDIVVDTNQNGKWNTGEPIDSDVDVGFTAIPEFATIAIPVAAIIGLFVLIRRRKQKQK